MQPSTPTPSNAISVSSPLTPYLSTINPSMVLEVVSGLVVLIWLIYTLVAAYHWFRYGYKSGNAVVAMSIFVFVSIVIEVYSVSGFIS